MSRVGTAIAFASHYHQEQVDKRGEPYILHPLRVMNSVRSAGYDDDHQIAAVLHDVLEDCFDPELSLGRVADEFGLAVKDAVDALTRRYHLHPDGPDMLDEFGARKWGEAIETYQQYFERCVQDPIAMVVKYFDILDNMDPKRYSSHAPYGRYAKGLQWYYDQGLFHGPNLKIGR